MITQNLGLVCWEKDQAKIQLLIEQVAFQAQPQNAPRPSNYGKLWSGSVREKKREKRRTENC